jgi:hypothetical protein
MNRALKRISRRLNGAMVMLVKVHIRHMIEEWRGVYA